MTEEECIAQVVRWELRFGWTGTYFTRKDAERQLGRPFTNEEWELFSNDPNWMDLGEEMAELGNSWILDTLNLVGIE